MAGNVATGTVPRALIDAGADAVKVGIGPGSICTTRIVAGVGRAPARRDHGGRRGRTGRGHPGLSPTAASNIRAMSPRRSPRRSAVMIGSLLPEPREPWRGLPVPGPVLQGLSRHGVRRAWARGSADRYFQAEVRDTLKLVPEGIEGQVPYKGPVSASCTSSPGPARLHGLCRRARSRITRSAPTFVASPAPASARAMPMT